MQLTAKLGRRRRPCSLWPSGHRGPVEVDQPRNAALRREVHGVVVDQDVHLVEHEGAPWGHETVLRATRKRVTPILMTALVTALGLLPLALGAGEAGREVEGPLALVVLGGLIQEGDTRGENRVPYLGRIPVLGSLFKTRTRQNEKRNLMVFLRPKIIRDAHSVAIETDAKYNYMRSEQIKSGRPKTEVLPLLPYTPEPRLPPVPSPLPPMESAPAPNEAPVIDRAVNA